MLTLFTILMCLAFASTVASRHDTERRLMSALTLLFTLAAMAVWLVQQGRL